jgi:tetratricopeptide (TPR) repeat protein
MINRLERLKVLAKERPEDAFTLFALAKEYERCNEWQESRALYEKIVAQSPEYIGAYYHLGQLLEDMELDENALKAYEKGILVAKHLGDQHALAELSNAAQNLRLSM